MRSPIINQLLIFGFISGLISLILACIGFGVVEFYKIKENSALKLQSQADMLTYNLQPTLLFDDKDAAEKILKSLKEDRSITKATVLKADGATFVSYRGDKGKSSMTINKEIIYQNKRIGELVMEANYLGMKEKYMAYLSISLLIIMISIPATYIISAPLRRQVWADVVQLEQQSSRLCQLADQVAGTEQKERKRIAALIHDHLQQILVASKIQLDLALRRLKVQEYEQAETKMTHSLTLLNEASTAARSLTVELRPPVLYEAGLAEAFAWLANKFKTDHNFDVYLKTEIIPDALSDNLKILVFESVKELLFNVVKYAGVHSADLQLQYRSDMLIVSIKDQGCGFDVGNIEKFSGMEGGFGIFSIQERIRLLKGTVKIVSRPNAGTSVELVVPVDKDFDKSLSHLSMAQEDARPLAPSTRQRINILLVDDHRIVREGLVNLLKENDMFNVVAQAENGEEAVEKTGIFQPDVVIMDVNMPKLNGIEATRIIKSRFAHVSIIGLSVQDERDVIDAMKKAGAVTLINKGGNPQELVETIIQCMPQYRKKV